MKAFITKTHDGDIAAYTTQKAFEDMLSITEDWNERFNKIVINSEYVVYIHKNLSNFYYIGRTTYIMEEHKNDK